MEDKTFESALLELESAVARLEAGDLTLQDSLEIYAQGQQLVAFCAKLLEEARLKVELLSADGELIPIRPNISE